MLAEAWPQAVRSSLKQRSSAKPPDQRPAKDLAIRLKFELGRELGDVRQLVGGVSTENVDQAGVVTAQAWV